MNENMPKKMVKKTKKSRDIFSGRKKMGNTYIYAYFIKSFYKDVPIPIFCDIIEAVKAVRFGELS